jgi:Spy/CpxP family protein refolding chaperone
MNSRGRAILLALGLGTLAATTAFAQPGFAGGGGPGGMGGHPGMDAGPGMEGDLGGFARVLGALELTDDQRSEIAGIMDTARFEIQSIRSSAEGVNPRETLMDLFLQDDLSVSEVEAVFSELDAIREQVRDVMVEALVEIHDVLTPEQLDRLSELVEMRAGMGGPGMGAPMGGPGMGSPMGGPPPGGNEFGF